MMRDLHMKKYNLRLMLSCIIVLIFFMFSCRKDTVGEKIKSMKEKSITIPLDSMVCWGESYERDALSVDSSLYKWIVYVDSTECSECFLKKMAKWYYLANDEKKTKVKLVFIIQSKQEQYKDLYAKMYIAHLRHTIYIDTNSCFEKNNPHLPKEHIYHTFLLDKDNNVILVGNPVDNSKVERMFKATITRSLTP